MSREEHSLETRKATLSPCSPGVLCLSLWTPESCGPAGESSKKNGKNSQQSGKERLKELGSSDWRQSKDDTDWGLQTEDRARMTQPPTLLHLSSTFVTHTATTTPLPLHPAARKTFLTIKQRNKAAKETREPPTPEALKSTDEHPPGLSFLISTPPPVPSSLKRDR